MGLIEEIIGISNDLKSKVIKYNKRRFIFEEVKKNLNSNLFVGVAGLRGIGKTILLLQLAKDQEKSIYFSLDTIKEKFGLFDVIKELNQKYNIKYVYLDEIHNYSNWQFDIKKIYDLLDVKLVFTSSVAIEIVESKYDLSRRVTIIKMYPFSFGEFLYFKLDKQFEEINLNNLLKYNYNKYLEYQTYYQEYISGGSLPASFESESGIIIPNIVDKIINRDLVAIKKLDQTDISSIYLLLKYVANNSVDVVGYNNIAKNVGLTKYKVQQYLDCLEKAFVLNIVFPNTRNVLKEPKILFCLPFRYFLAKNPNDDILVGALREDFFVYHCFIKGLKISYIKSEKGQKLPDYLLSFNNEKYVFEIGGKNKSEKQFKGIDRSKIKTYLVQNPLGRDDALPLILFGLIE